MSDLIDRAEAQTEIQFAARRYTVAHEARGEGRVVWSDNLISVADAMNALRKVPSALPTQRWIPCSERLPEKGKEVLVCYDFKGHRSVLIGTLYGDGKFHGYDDEYLTAEGRKYRKAVAWMPLPEPFKAERREE